MHTFSLILYRAVCLPVSARYGAVKMTTIHSSFCSSSCSSCSSSSASSTVHSSSSSSSHHQHHHHHHYRHNHHHHHHHPPHYVEVNTVIDFVATQSPQASSSVLHAAMSPEGSTGVKRVHYADKARDPNRLSTESQPHASPVLPPSGPAWTQQHPRSATAGVRLGQPRMVWSLMSTDIGWHHYYGQTVTNACARFDVALRPQKPYGSLGRGAQDGRLDFHTAPELWPAFQSYGPIYIYVYVIAQSTTVSLPVLT